MAGRKYLGPYSDSDDIATKAKVDAAASGSTFFYTSLVDNNTYSTSDTSYVTVATVSFTMPSDGLIQVTVTAQIKCSVNATSYCGIFLDSTMLKEVTASGSSYVDVFYAGVATVTAGSRSIYIKHKAKVLYTNYIQNIRVLVTAYPS